MVELPESPGVLRDAGPARGGACASKGLDLALQVEEARRAAPRHCTLALNRHFTLFFAILATDREGEGPQSSFGNGETPSRN